MDTIFALSSGALPSGVAIVRISGPQAFQVADTFSFSTPSARKATLVSLTDPADSTTIDNCVALAFPGPNSFTGDDVLELQLHGSRAIVGRVLAVLGERSGWRTAEAGEFTRRAFENGRMDLTAVEGLGDLLAAETEQQRKYAVQQSDGALRRNLEGLRSDLLHQLATLEASLEFADEEDVPDDGLDVISGGLGQIRKDVATLLGSFETGRIVRDGYKVVLVGAPNVGKSSLLNALAGSDRAIVTPEAGTTRDLLEVEIDVAGFLVRIIDTAGIRDAESVAEQEGVRRSKLAVDAADLVVSLQTGDLGPVQLERDDVLPVWSQADRYAAPRNMLAICAPEKRGLDDLFTVIQARLNEVDLPSAGVINRARHVATLNEVQSLLDVASQVGLEHDIRAEHIRQAAAEIGRLTGRIHPEEVLDRVFKGFCIGK